MATSVQVKGILSNYRKLTVGMMPILLYSAKFSGLIWAQQHNVIIILFAERTDQNKISVNWSNCLFFTATGTMKDEQLNAYICGTEEEITQSSHLVSLVHWNRSAYR